MQISIETHENGDQTVSLKDEAGELVVNIFVQANGYTNVDVYREVAARVFELTDGTIAERHDLELPSFDDSFFSIDFGGTE